MGSYAVDKNNDAAHVVIGFGDSSRSRKREISMISMALSPSNFNNVIKDHKISQDDKTRNLHLGIN